MDQKESAPPGGPHCNLDFLENSLGRNRTTALRLVGLFLDSYPGLLRRLEEAMTARDFERLGQVVHDIRGNCVLFSAQECLAQTIRMEGLLRKTAVSDGLPEGGVDWHREVAALRAALGRMTGELNAYLASGAK